MDFIRSVTDPPSLCRRHPLRRREVKATGRRSFATFCPCTFVPLGYSVEKNFLELSQSTDMDHKVHSAALEDQSDSNTSLLIKYEFRGRVKREGYWPNQR